MITFFIPVEPKPLQRARISARGGFARMYDSPDNVRNKADVKACAVKAMGKRKPLKGPLYLEVMFYLTKPKSKTRKNSNPFPHPDAKPDLDNLLKLIMDALNGVTWVDDAQVIDVHARKWWADPDFPSGTRVEIRELKNGVWL